MAQKAKLIDITKSFYPCDPNTFPSNLHYTGQEDNPDQTPPVLPYEGYNFLPTSYGYRSYFGTSSIMDITALPTNCSNVLVYMSETYQNMLIAFCSDGIYTATAGATEWTHSFPLEDTWVASFIYKQYTYCIIENNLYIYRQGHTHVIKIDDTLTITSFVPSFINMAGQMGIFRANGRLGFWDSEDSVAWSSAFDLADFTPSIENMVGNCKFLGVSGRITTILAHGEGFVIYCTKSIVGVSYATNNQGVLWDAMTITSQGGVAYAKSVCMGNIDKEHYAVSSIGIGRIGPFNALSRQYNLEMVLPELYDLLKESRFPIALTMVQGRFLYFSTEDLNYINGVNSNYYQQYSFDILQMLKIGDFDPFLSYNGMVSEGYIAGYDLYKWLVNFLLTPNNSFAYPLVGTFDTPKWCISYNMPMSNSFAATAGYYDTSYSMLRDVYGMDVIAMYNHSDVTDWTSLYADYDITAAEAANSNNLSDVWFGYSMKDYAVTSSDLVVGYPQFITSGNEIELQASIENPIVRLDTQNYLEYLGLDNTFGGNGPSYDVLMEDELYGVDGLGGASVMDRIYTFLSTTNKVKQLSIKMKEKTIARFAALPKELIGSAVRIREDSPYAGIDTTLTSLYLAPECFIRVQLNGDVIDPVNVPYAQMAGMDLSLKILVGYDALAARLYSEQYDFVNVPLVDSFDIPKLIGRIETGDILIAYKEIQEIKTQLEISSNDIKVLEQNIRRIALDTKEDYQVPISCQTLDDLLNGTDTESELFWDTSDTYCTWVRSDDIYFTLNPGGNFILCPDDLKSLAARSYPHPYWLQDSIEMEANRKSNTQIINTGNPGFMTPFTSQSGETFYINGLTLYYDTDINDIYFRIKGTIRIYSETYPLGMDIPDTVIALMRTWNRYRDVTPIYYLEEIEDPDVGSQFNTTEVASMDIKYHKTETLVKSADSIELVTNSVDRFAPRTGSIHDINSYLVPYQWNVPVIVGAPTPYFTFNPLLSLDPLMYDHMDPTCYKIIGCNTTFTPYLDYIDGGGHSHYSTTGLDLRFAFNFTSHYKGTVAGFLTEAGKLPNALDDSGCDSTLLATLADVYSFPDGSFVIQNGTAFGGYFLFEGAFVLDTQLKKWGKYKGQHYAIIEYSPHNDTQNVSIPYTNFGMDAGIIAADRSLRLFSTTPEIGYIRYGKVGYYRLGFTECHEVILNFRRPATGVVVIEGSIDDRFLDSNSIVQQDFTDALQCVVKVSLSARWYSISISGDYDLTGIDFRGTMNSRR